MDLNLGGRSINVTLTQGAPRVLAIQRRAAPVLALGRTGLQGPQGPVGPAGGTVAKRLASGPISGHRAVRTLGAACAYASCDAAAHADTYLGISIGAAEDGGEVSIAVQDEVVEPGWSFNPGPVFLDLNGALVQPAPTVADGAVFVRQVGVAVAPDRLLVQSRPPIFII